VRECVIVCKCVGERMYVSTCVCFVCVGCVCVYVRL
jgi:hypothetical protein